MVTCNTTNLCLIKTVNTLECRFSVYIQNKSNSFTSSWLFVFHNSYSATTNNDKCTNNYSSMASKSSDFRTLEMWANNFLSSWLVSTVFIFTVCLQCFDTGVRKSSEPVKNWVMRCSHGICPERGAKDLHMVKLMPLPPHHLLQVASVKSRMVYLSVAGLPRLSWKRGHYMDVCCYRFHYVNECFLILIVFCSKHYQHTMTADLLLFYKHLNRH